MSLYVVGVELSRCRPIRLATCRVAACRVLIVGWQPVGLPIWIYQSLVFSGNVENGAKTSMNHCRIIKGFPPTACTDTKQRNQLQNFDIELVCSSGLGGPIDYFTRGRAATEASAASNW